MFFGRWTSWRALYDSHFASRFTTWLFSICLLAGCGEISSPLASHPNGAELPDARTQATDRIGLRTVQATHHLEAADQQQLAAIMPALDYLPKIDGLQPTNPASPGWQDERWSFSTDKPVESSESSPMLSRLPAVFDATNQEATQQYLAADNSAYDPPALIRLPLAEPSARASEVTPELVGEETSTHTELPMESQFEFDEILLEPEAESEVESIGNLFPPEPIFRAELEACGAPLSFAQANLPATLTTTPNRVAGADASWLDELSQQERLLAALTSENSSATTGALTGGRLNDVARKKIQHAFTMASRGSLYVARQELIEVLRMISRAKDAEHGSPVRSVALAAGLRALREAEDFVPSGTQLEAELDIAVLCASHRTPLSKRPDSANLLPQLMMDRYLRYAQLQLAMSAAGEPAGSMALHALGKLNSELGRTEPTKHQLADRHAIAYQQAALLAHNQNYLAAHELGVLLATSGHLVEAQQLLRQVAARESNPIVYRNLARIQDQLGQPGPALANRDLARQLAQQGPSGMNYVQWVSPSQFSQSPIESPPTLTAMRPSTAERPLANQTIIPGTRPRRPQRPLLQ